MANRQGDLLADLFAKPPAPTYRSGFAELDRVTDGGFHAGESTLIGGFTGQAKSAFAEQAALAVSIDVEVLYVPLEMGVDLTRLRMGAKLARTSLGAFRRAGMDLLTRGELNARKLDVYVPKQHTIAAIESLVARAKHRVIVIDDCRSIDGVVIEGSAPSQAHAIAGKITKIAEHYGVHVLALQQLDPRSFRLGASEWRFQDSTRFEQRAYNSITVYRPFKHRSAAADVVAEIRVRKNRNGPSAKMHYRWVGETMSFWEFLPHELDALECCKPKKKASAG